MDALIFLLDFPYINEFLIDYKDYYKIVIVDRKRKINRAELNRYYDEVCIVSDIQCKSEMEQTFSRILESRQILAVYGTYESVVEMAGYLRETFDIPGMKYNASLRVRHKYMMKQTAVKQGIDTAKAILARNVADVWAFIKENGYPIVIKPVSGFATKYTYKIDSLSDFFEFKIMKMLFRHREFVIETFVNGEEYHCDSVVVDGKVVFSSVGKNLHNNLDTVSSGKPKGSIIFPSYCDQDKTIRDIKDFNERVIGCYDIQDAVCHVEVFINHEDRVVLGEIAVRIGGSPCIGACIKNTHDIDINKAFTDVELKNYRSEGISNSLVFTGYLAFPSKKGTIVEISNVEDFYHIDGVKKVTIGNKPGDRIMKQSHTAVRTGYIIIEDRNYHRLREKLIHAFNSFRLTVK